MTTNNAMHRLLNAKGFIFDVDGTLALADKKLSGYKALPGAVELIALLRKRGVPVAAFTNGSTKHPRVLNTELANIGLQFEEQLTLTPVSIAVTLFKQKRYKKILVLGGKGVYSPLEEAGFDVVRAPDRADDADAVVIGWYPEFTVPDLEAATRAIWNGAAFFTVSKAPYVASREGRTIGISGAIAAAVRSITGKNAVIVGKPSTHALNVASVRLNLHPKDLVIVGDDPGLENAMAVRGGSISVGVQTGLATAADFAALGADIQPHFSLSGIDKLLEMLT
ncbi:MAG: HAD hydrolase-like protein [Burkholderiales bacterium]|nr:HAD hydrolase-like protein [Burkholderiales bacterium]